MAAAKAKIEARAAQRHEHEKAAFDDKIKQRQAKEAATGKKPGGRPPKPPAPGARASDQINLTDEESRIMPVGSEIWPEECEPLLKKIGAETIGDVADYLNKSKSEDSSADDVLFTALLKICYENMDMDGKMVFWEDMLENNSLEWRDVE